MRTKRIHWDNLTIDEQDDRATLKVLHAGVNYAVAPNLKHRLVIRDGDIRYIQICRNGRPGFSRSSAPRFYRPCCETCVGNMPFAPSNYVSIN